MCFIGIVSSKYQKNCKVFYTYNLMFLCGWQDLYWCKDFICSSTFRNISKQYNWHLSPTQNALSLLCLCYKFKYKRYTLRIRLYTFRHTYEKLRNDTRHKEPYFSTREFISWQLRLVNIQKSGPKDFANGDTLKCTKQSITRNINYWHEKKKSLGTPLSCRLWFREIPRTQVWSRLWSI